MSTSEKRARKRPGAGGLARRRDRYRLSDAPDLPPTLKPQDAFALIGIGRTAGYDLIRRKELPALRLGGKLLVPTAPLLRLIGLPSDDAGEEDGGA